MGSDNQQTLETVSRKGKMEIGGFEVCSRDFTPQWMNKKLSRHSITKKGEEIFATISQKSGFAFARCS